MAAPDARALLLLTATAFALAAPAATSAVDSPPPFAWDGAQDAIPLAPPEQAAWRPAANGWQSRANANPAVDNGWQPQLTAQENGGAWELGLADDNVQANSGWDTQPNANPSANNGYVQANNNDWQTQQNANPLAENRWEPQVTAQENGKAWELGLGDDNVQHSNNGWLTQGTAQENTNPLANNGWEPQVAEYNNEQPDDNGWQTRANANPSDDNGYVQANNNDGQIQPNANPLADSGWEPQVTAQENADALELGLADGNVQANNNGWQTQGNVNPSADNEWQPRGTVLGNAENAWELGLTDGNAQPDNNEWEPQGTVQENADALELGLADDSAQPGNNGWQIQGTGLENSPVASYTNHQPGNNDWVPLGTGLENANPLVGNGWEHQVAGYRNAQPGNNEWMLQGTAQENTWEPPLADDNPQPDNNAWEPQLTALDNGNPVDDNAWNSQLAVNNEKPDNNEWEPQGTALKNPHPFEQLADNIWNTEFAAQNNAPEPQMTAAGNDNPIPQIADNGPTGDAHDNVNPLPEDNAWESQLGAVDNAREPLLAAQKDANPFQQAADNVWDTQLGAIDNAPQDNPHLAFLDSGNPLEQPANEATDPDVVAFDFPDNVNPLEQAKDNVWDPQLTAIENANPLAQPAENENQDEPGAANLDDNPSEQNPENLWDTGLAVQGDSAEPLGPASAHSSSVGGNHLVEVAVSDGQSPTNIENEGSGPMSLSTGTGPLIQTGNTAENHMSDGYDAPLDTPTVAAADGHPAVLDTPEQPALVGDGHDTTLDTPDVTLEARALNFVPMDAIAAATANINEKISEAMALADAQVKAAVQQIQAAKELSAHVKSQVSSTKGKPHNQAQTSAVKTYRNPLSDPAHETQIQGAPLDIRFRSQDIPIDSESQVRFLPLDTQEEAIDPDANTQTQALGNEWENQPNPTREQPVVQWQLRSNPQDTVAEDHAILRESTGQRTFDIPQDKISRTHPLAVERNPANPADALSRKHPVLEDWENPELSNPVQTLAQEAIAENQAQLVTSDNQDDTDAGGTEDINLDTEAVDASGNTDPEDNDEEGDAILERMLTEALRALPEPRAGLGRRRAWPVARRSRVPAPAGLCEYFGAGGDAPIHVRSGASRSLQSAVADPAALLTQLEASVVIRDNLVTALGFVLHASPPIPHALYSSLYLLHGAVRLRRVSAAPLVHRLGALAGASPGRQMLELLRGLREGEREGASASRGLRSNERAGVSVSRGLRSEKRAGASVSRGLRSEERAGDSVLGGAVTEVEAEGEEVVEEVIRPGGGPLMVDLLAGVDAAGLRVLERDVVWRVGVGVDEKAKQFYGAEVFGRVFAALKDGSLVLSQSLFAVLLVSRPLDHLDGVLSETERSLSATLRLDAIQSWSAITRSITLQHLSDPLSLLQHVLGKIAASKDTPTHAREDARTLTHYLRPPSPTYAHDHYAVMAPVVSKPSIDVLSLLRTIAHKEYPTYIVRARNRLVEYILDGQLNVEFVTKGFNRFDHVTPMNLLVAFLTRINRRLPQLPDHILKTVKQIQLYLKYKIFLCTMSPKVPASLWDSSALVSVYDDPTTPENVTTLVAKLAEKLSEEDIAWEEVAQTVSVQYCGRPRRCVYSFVRNLVYRRFVRKGTTYKLIKQFLSQVDRLGNPLVKQKPLKDPVNPITPSYDLASSRRTMSSAVAVATAVSGHPVYNRLSPVERFLAEVDRAAKICRTLPFPALNVVQQEEPALVDYPATSLPPTLNGSQEHAKMLPAHMLLSWDKLPRLLGRQFKVNPNIKKGELLQALLNRISRIRVINKFPELNLYVQSFLQLIKSFRKTFRAESVVYFPSLLNALPLVQTDVERQYMAKLENYFTKPDFYKLLGPDFDPRVNKTRGALLKYVLNRINSSPMVNWDPILKKSIDYYKDRVYTNGYGAQEVEWALISEASEPAYVDMTVFRVLDHKKMPQDALKAEYEMIRFIFTQFIPNVHLKDLNVKKFKTKGQFLKGTFEYLLKQSTVSPRIKDDIQMLMKYIRMNGRGAEPLDYDSVAASSAT